MPSKIDPEPYFFRWDSVVPLGSKNQPDLINVPCFQHKTCGLLVRVDETRIPPKICPMCGMNTVQEANKEKSLKETGAVLLDCSSVSAALKPETFKLDPAEGLTDE